MSPPKPPTVRPARASAEQESALASLDVEGDLSGSGVTGRPAPDAPLADDAAQPDGLLRVARATSEGDPDAAATLILQLGGGILRVVRKVFGPDHPDLDDIAQESTLAVLSALPQFRGESSVAHFAYRVTLLTALGARRKMRAQMRKAQEEASPLDEVEDNNSSPFAGALEQRRREVVLELLEELSEPVAQALALHFMLGHSVEEIASTLGLSQHTVWSRLRLGKQALRRKLSKNAALREMLEVPE